MLNHDAKEKFPADLEEVIPNPKILGTASPDGMVLLFKKPFCRRI